MKKIISTVYFLLNLSLAIYGVLLISQSNQFNELLSQRKPPYQPTGDQWKMLSDPKHFPFLKGWMQKPNIRKAREVLPFSIEKFQDVVAHDMVKKVKV